MTPSIHADPLAPPTITTDPEDQSVTLGETATFGVTAHGNPAPTYQWMKNSRKILGATDDSYTTPPTTSFDNQSAYYCVVTNGPEQEDTIFSAIATLTVLPPLSAPVITAQPTRQTITVGERAEFRVYVRSNPPPTYQWRRNGMVIENATQPTFVIPITTLEDHQSSYSCDVANALGEVTSESALLKVYPKADCSPTLTINSHPLNLFEDISYDITEGCIATDLHVYLRLTSNYWNDDGAVKIIELPSSLTGTFKLDNDAPDHLFAETLFATFHVEGTTADGIPVHTEQDLTPKNRVAVHLESNIPGIDLTINNKWGSAKGQIIQEFLGGAQITLSASDFQYIDGFTYKLIGWSDGGLPSHDVTLPDMANDNELTSIAHVHYEAEYVDFTNPSPAHFIEHPSNQFITEGQTATFSVVATGSPPPHFQWVKNDVIIPNATEPSYTLTATLEDDGAVFSCKITNLVRELNQLGEIYSEPALLTVTPAPCLQTLTTSRALFNPFQGVDYEVVDSCIASGLHVYAELTSSYWADENYVKYIELPALLKGTFKLENETPDHVFAETFSITIHVEGTTAKGEFVELKTDSLTPESYVFVNFQSNISGIDFAINNKWGPLRSPLVQEFLGGAKITISAPEHQTINGRTYQFVRWSDEGAATHDVTLQEFPGIDHDPVFEQVTYEAEYLDITDFKSPLITEEPSDQSVTAGETATFNIVATGNPVPTYQWRKNGVAIPGAKSANYTTPITTREDNGTIFNCVVSNSQNNVTSVNATLTVTAPDQLIPPSEPEPKPDPHFEPEPVPPSEPKPEPVPDPHFEPEPVPPSESEPNPVPPSEPEPAPPSGPTPNLPSEPEPNPVPPSDPESVTYGFVKFQNVVDPHISPMTIRYSVSDGDSVDITVYDRQGYQVRSLVDVAGHPEHHAEWDGRNDDGRMVSSDIYWVILKIGGKMLKQKVAILK